MADRTEAFARLPDWARGGESAGSDLDIADDVFTVRVDGAEPLISKFPFIGAAILVELTRYGNGIVTNPNGTGSNYVKITFAKHPKDSMPVSRIIADALPRQAVHPVGDLGDYRPEFLEKRGAGKAAKNARETAVRHSVELCREAGADADAYEANLRALFEMHDDLLLGRFDY
ncbi:hypothetical protein ACFZ8E_22710 [Methylobacterium sp. HMF5984]|uniref:hypothetical protein n=1 Tax=Methylobacterium sp. HMF5984 TaxID=3367370 RepID=UPI003852D198